ncbi:MAG TPA: hypothetical protein VJS85_09160 [Rhizomicrobium sp.]|nr:hypothetical protein [Rhizomicrobium sp.]
MAAIQTGAAVIGVLKSAYDVFKGVRESNDPVKLKAAINELGLKLSDAISDVILLQSEIAELKQRAENADLQKAKGYAFQEEKDRYVRIQSRGGAFVYVEKDTAQGQGSSPEYCAHCFENDKRSMLQPVGMMGVSVCPGCQAHINTGR